MLKVLPEDAQLNATIEMMIAEAVKTSEIEGEFISRKDVLSSIRKNLGLKEDTSRILDKKAEGVAGLMLDVRQTFHEPLTREKLFAWHIMLLAGTPGIEIGGWRTHPEPMQIISGALNKQKIHFEAPPSAIIPSEMERFITWFNDTAPGGGMEIKHSPARSALAHVYFESVHPFEDGNGRIGRAIAEKALSQGLGRPVLLSLSRTIEARKKDYYAALEQAQRSNELTLWINYFVKTVLLAQTQAEEEIDFTLKKTKFFDRFKNQFNERQLIVVQRMLEEGAAGFLGGMNAGKYVSIAKTSKSTATRDLQELATKGIFLPVGAGRSSRYEINL